MLAEIQTLGFFVFIDAEPNHFINDEEDRGRSGPAPDDCSDNAFDLNQDLSAIALECTWGAADGFNGEHAG